MLYLEYIALDGLPRRLFVSPDEPVVFGSGKSADKSLPNERGIAEKHFTILILNGTWYIEAFEGLLLYLNDSPISKSKLKDKDVIRAGETLFFVKLPSVQPSPHVQIATEEHIQPQTKPPSLPPLMISYESLPCGITVATIADGVERFDEILGGFRRWVSDKRNHSYFLWNQHRFDSPKLKETWDSSGVNLIQHAPETIRLTDSLHIGSGTFEPQCFDEVSKILGHDAGVLVASSLDQETFCDTQKITWAWYTRPSILQQQLLHGSDHLANILFQGVHIALINPANSSDVLLFGRADKLESLASALGCY